ncbi:DEAD/DEAH box helicase family protein [Cuspidothrix issatschenkoi]|uniref:DEAD/DEAH box helicase family protein n=1 Tax=Cuspidothrix issatschenkoi TaxID=230752 RepID=UPI001D148394|nr:DEAD/DEAH box helicase family protein [Cuspidothrix issatschenkoi]
MTYEVNEPILNSPFDEPSRYWFIREGYEPELKEGRRPAIVYPPREIKIDWNLGKVLKPSRPDEFAPGYEMVLVNHIRERVKDWRSQRYPGVTRTTLELLEYWNRDGRERRLFFAQREAVETIIFLKEARADFLQGINIPSDEPIDTTLKAFIRYACKMATGSGKTTVMGMLAAWSILNKVNNRSDSRFSDVVLIVCPNVTIKGRLQELNPNNGEASLYRTRDLVPSNFMDKLRQGKVLVTNWHIFEKRAPSTSGDDPAKVVKVGVPTITTETIKIAAKNETARGTRYLTLESLQQQIVMGQLEIREEKKDKQGNLISVQVKATRYLESDAAWIKRILADAIGNKGNILVFNDEAHHAYRIAPNEKEDDSDDDEIEEYEEKEATIWVEGLDRIHKYRGINFCVDLSATPYYLKSARQDGNKPFEWVISDFSLMDAIESGLVKIPQLPIRDTTGAEISDLAYFNIWKWIMQKMTLTERGKKGASPKAESVLKYTEFPITILGKEWEKIRQQWLESDDPRPPVFIIVCKNTKIAKCIYDWIAENQKPVNVPPCKIETLRNTETEINTIRVDSKVVEELESGNTKSDESKWMRFTLDTIGKTEWLKDNQGKSIYPEDFVELAIKLNRPLHPPGRDIRCIISVGMLTEGWDCLDSETEILTPSGWVGRGQIKEGDLVYSLNKETEKLEIVPVLEYGERKVRPDECMVKIESQHLNIRVTERHQFHIKYRNPSDGGNLSQSFLTKTAYEIYERRSAYSLPLSAETAFSFVGIPLNDDEIRFIAWFMTNGGFSGSKVVISQSKHYHNEIRDLLNRLELDYTEQIIQAGENSFSNAKHYYRFVIPQGTHKGSLKRNGWIKYQDYLDKDVSPLLHQMTREQFLIFWAELLKGDGEQLENKSGWLWCCEKSQVDAYTQMAIVRGLSASYHNRITNSGKVVYRVSVRDRQWITSDPNDYRSSKAELEKPLPEETVWCIRNQNSTIIIRRHGKIVILGNCNTVTHVIGIRPFMSQLLCEQVVGRALRRRNYDLTTDNKFEEETAKIFGVPFEVIPFKENPLGAKRKPEKRYHVYAVPGKSQYKIEFPRVKGYTQAIQNRVTVNWEAIAPLEIDPFRIAPEVEVKYTIPNNQGRPSLAGPGKLESIDLNPYRKDKRFQELAFDLAKDLTVTYVTSENCEAPPHVLFPQLRKICDRYLSEKVTAFAPADILDVFLSPYYGWVIERLVEAIHPDKNAGETPEIPIYDTPRGKGSTDDVNFWTSKDIRDVVKSHVNCIVADTWQWEQAAAYIIDTHPAVEAFVKNAGLGFTIPYFDNGENHDYIPDFIIRFNTPQLNYLILETKGYDLLRDVKRNAAIRWCHAINANGKHGYWQYAMTGLKEVRQLIDEAVKNVFL